MTHLLDTSTCIEFLNTARAAAERAGKDARKMCEAGAAERNLPTASKPVKRRKGERASKSQPEHDAPLFDGLAR